MEDKPVHPSGMQKEQDKTDISDISVLIKLTVVNEKEKINEIAPKLVNIQILKTRSTPQIFVQMTRFMLI